jgi:sigma-B regulation protein RsbU (phosphoserine phosphatase)
MTKAVKQFVDNAEQSDDLTMLAIKYTVPQRADITVQHAITLPNDVEEVPRLAAFVDQVCEEAGYSMEMTMDMNLAIEEAVVNVMDYAYEEGTKGNVHIEAEADASQLTIIISDWGKPFDPTSKPDVDTSMSAEERDIGGLGIHLVRQIMDSVSYERIQDTNRLTLRKKTAI